jgi:hypothetical protein
MPTEQVRPLSPDELMNSATLHLTRLARGVCEMDENVPEAVIDVSASLRQLVGHGRGNRLLQRLAESNVTLAPRLGAVANEIDTSPRKNIRFALGAFPTELAAPSGATGPELPQFLKLKCLRVASPRLQEEVTYTWDDLISVVANKLGCIHTDDERRAILDDLACYLVADLPALRYAIRTIGAAISSLGILQLESIGREIGRAAPPLFRPDSTELHAALVIGGLDTSHLDVRALIRFHAGVKQNLIEWVERGDPDWLFHPPDQAEANVYRRSLVRAGRNDPCPCGSGRKYKRCCGS